MRNKIGRMSENVRVNVNETFHHSLVWVYFIIHSYYE